MTFSFLRSRNISQGLKAGSETFAIPTGLVIPAETEALRRGPYAKASDEGALYRAASAAGGATAMVHYE